MKVVVVAKTRMGRGACIGALTFDGRSLRLIASDRETNEQFNMDYQVGDVWDIEATEDPEIVPPHIENVIVKNKQFLAPISGMIEFIETQMPPISGGIEILFDGLTQTTNAGARYITARTGIPQRSTLFWRPDQPLIRDDVQKRIRYRYPDKEDGSTLTFVGFQEPLEEVPAGTLIRVSLAHWWCPKEKPQGELRCYVQISGWFLSKRTAISQLSPTQQRQIDRDPDQDTYVNKALQDVFGYSQFRPFQREIIARILQKQDTLGVMPTGSGKSLCFQLPATIFSGLTVVVSPLISLMEDQVLELKELGIPADYLNSTLSYEQYLAAVQRIKTGDTRLLYAAPETLLRPETILLLETCLVDCLVIDEAHCISEWGHDFRPEYRQLDSLRSRLPEAVTLAITATATKRVREDIKQSLRIPDANEYVSSFNRENLILSVVDKINGLEQTKAFLEGHQDQAGIIYCATRRKVAELSFQLQELGYPVLPYHGGMEDEVRRRNQHRFRFEEGIIIVATIAFGMGINKPNVRFILHYDLPKNLENYYQQVGRAGRDGLPADCLTLYSYGDVKTHEFFISQEDPKLQPGSRMRLRALLDFLGTTTCRRKPLLAYFGENYGVSNCCACDNCTNKAPKQFGLIQPRVYKDAASAENNRDLTIPAQQFLSCVQETGEIFGINHLIRVLRGSKAKKIIQFKHDQLDCYGIGCDNSEEVWRHLASQFIRQGLIERTKPHDSLVLTKKGKGVLKGDSVWGELPGVYARIFSTDAKVAYNVTLFEKLQTLRSDLARERNLPPYVIFHDRALMEMATFFPHAPADFSQIYGVGKRKAAAYGQLFLSVIRSFCAENRISQDQDLNIRISQKGVLAVSERRLYVWKKFQAGEGVKSLANTLGFTMKTILGYLEAMHSSGHPLRIDGLKEISTLSPVEENQVIQAFDEHGTYRLKPVFDSLDGIVSYDQLHLWRLIYQVMNPELSEEQHERSISSGS